MIKLNKFRQILAIVIVVTIATLAITLYLKFPDFRKKAAIARLPQNIDISIRTVTYSETRDGVKKWVLEAQQADVSQKDKQVYLNRPRFTVFLQQQSRVVTTTADTAVYDTTTRDVTMTDNVVATSDDGMKVETDKAFYNAGQSTLSSDNHVKIMYRNSIVEGDGMEIHTVNGTVQLLRNVSAKLLPGEP